MLTAAQAVGGGRGAVAADHLYVDADVHPHIADWTEVIRHVPPGLRPRFGGRRGPRLAVHGFKAIGVGYGSGVTVPSGGHPAADPQWVREHYVRPRGLDRVVLTTPLLNLSAQPNIDLATAIAQAVNDWTLEKWVRPFDCFKASILVAQQDPDRAAAEIDRLGDDPGMVQVLLNSAGKMPLGKRAYHPIYEACARHGLPVALHFGGEGAGQANTVTAVGYPSTYLEWYGALPQTYLAHVTSMVTEGVFDRFPSLRVVLCEGGVVWLPHLMWRFDKNWKSLRAEVPWMRRFPSQYIADHFYHTVYPLESIPEPEYLSQLLEMLNGGDRLLFSSNYPYCQFGDPFATLEEFPQATRRSLLSDNARTLYGDRLMSSDQ